MYYYRESGSPSSASSLNDDVDSSTEIMQKESETLRVIHPIRVRFRQAKRMTSIRHLSMLLALLSVVYLTEGIGETEQVGSKSIIFPVHAQKKYWPKADRIAYDEYHAALKDPTIQTNITRYGNFNGNLKKAWWDMVYLWKPKLDLNMFGGFWHTSRIDEDFRANMTENTTQAELLDAIGAHDSSNRRKLQAGGREDDVILDLGGVQLIGANPSCWINWNAQVSVCDEANICTNKEMEACLVNADDDAYGGLFGFYAFVSYLAMYIIYWKLYQLARMCMLSTQ